MRVLMCLTPLLAGCVTMEPPETCEKWTEQETEFVHSLVIEVLTRDEPKLNVSNWTEEQHEQLKRAISESANELFATEN